MLKIAYVANEPPPYRIPIFNRIARSPDVELQVIFCCRHEPNRLWNLPPFEFDHVYLKERIKTTTNKHKKQNKPNKNSTQHHKAQKNNNTKENKPTHLYAFSYAWLKGLA